jgi:hypothetical protein
MFRPTKQTAIGSIHDSIDFYTGNITLANREAKDRQSKSRRLNIDSRRSRHAQERNPIQQSRIGLVSNLLRNGSLQYCSPVEFGKGLDIAQTSYEAFICFRFGRDTEW